LSRSIKDKLHQKKASLIEQQDLMKVTRQDIFTETESNNFNPLYQSRKGRSRDMPKELRSWYQSLRFGRDGCGIYHECTSKRNNYLALWTVEPSA
jgi:predicted  nucleic acid-binding Zn-ribbon protein